MNNITIATLDKIYRYLVDYLDESTAIVRALWIVTFLLLEYTMNIHIEVFMLCLSSNSEAETNMRFYFLPRL
jgi:hypothetical protein